MKILFWKKERPPDALAGRLGFGRFSSGLLVRKSSGLVSSRAIADAQAHQGGQGSRDRWLWEALRARVPRACPGHLDAKAGHQLFDEQERADGISWLECQRA